MSSIRKASERLEEYGRPVTYHIVTTTRRLLSPICRVQAVMGRWRDVGIGLTYEDAKEAAAESVIEKYHESKTPIVNKENNLEAFTKSLEKRLKALELTTKEFGMDRIDDIVNKIDDQSYPMEEHEMSDLCGEACEVMTKLGQTLQITEKVCEIEYVVIITLLTDDNAPKMLIEFGREKSITKMRALANVLISEKHRLEEEIRKQAAENKKGKKKYNKQNQVTKRRQNKRWGREK